MTADKSKLPQMPSEPIHRVVGPLTRFLHIEAASGVVLLCFTVTALVLANSPWSAEFASFWEQHVELRWGAFHFDQSVKHVINDGLMTIFFFVIGLEVKRELAVGELRDTRRAALPIAAAIGGMLLPAGFYLALQFGEPGMRGWGIPMATDIAFVVGCMAVLGRRVPRGLRVMLLSLAIADDIGAILVIAIGYTDNLSFTWLIWGFVGLAVVFACARLGIRSFAVYVICGIFIWYAFHESKVHATIAGVLLGLMTPARVYVSPSLFAELMARVSGIDQQEWESDHQRAAKLRRFQWATRETISPLEYLENALHPWVSFVIMPVFALANAGVRFQPSYLASGTALAVMLGLIVGKPVGITLFSWLAVRSHMASLPRGVGWRHVVAGGCLSGIGFTMAIFIAGLAFESSPQLLDVAKVGVIVASVASALLGTGLLLAARPESDLAGGPPEV